MQQNDGDNDPEPRWPVVVALLAVGGLYTALPRSLLPTVPGIPTVAIRWLLMIVVALLLIPTIVTHKRGDHERNQILGYIVTGLVTASLVYSLCLLVYNLPLPNREPPTILLRSAVALWVTNVLVFALWYWRLDAGGPHARDLRPGHTDGAFLFPQMTMSDQAKAAAGLTNWSPQFVDYLFLAYNTSTALSPADTSALSRWAKLLMMVQATISLAVVALLAARAVNIL